MVDKIIVPRRIEDFFDSNGNFTSRAFRFFESLTENTNESSAYIDDISGVGSLNAIVLGLQKQVGSGKKLTVDTTGFTVDTTFLTADETEA